MMIKYLLTDVSFGPLGFFLLLLDSPVAVALLAALGFFLLYKGIRAIMRHLPQADGQTDENAAELKKEEPAAGEAALPEEKNEDQ